MGKTDEKLDQAKAAMVERLLSDMEAEGADWVRDWADCGTPFNPVTGTVYRGRNALLLMCAIAAEGLTDPRFMTFAQAKAAGYKVRKGCHGYPIEKWREMWFSRADPTARVAQPKTKADAARCEDDPDMFSRWLPVGHFTLFNASDIEGIEPYLAEKDPFEADDLALFDYLETYSPCKVVEALQGRAFYSPASDAITIPVRSQFADLEGAARTLLHEIGHATGHASRLDRPMTGKYGEESYAREELIAEMCCMFTAAALGTRMPKASGDREYWANHVSYIRSWLKACGDDAAAEVMRAATAAANASDWLMRNCFPVEQAEAEPEALTA